MRTGNCLSHRRRQGEDVGWLVAGKQGDMIGVSRLFLFINADSQAVRYCSKKLPIIFADISSLTDYRYRPIINILEATDYLPIWRLSFDILAYQWSKLSEICYVCYENMLPE
jgi:hypothetical protein